jgi:hypothetical protein
MELLSPEWVQMVRSYLEEVVRQLPPAADGVEYRYCTSLLNPPAHLDDGTGRVAYWISIKIPTVEVGSGEREDCGPVLRQDYQTVLPHAREQLDLSDPELVTRREAERQAKVAAGEPLPAPPPPELVGVLVGLHNYRAARTA